jgi:hypothetical protein
MLNELLYLDLQDLSGKLFCTFSSKDNLDTTLADIKQKYTIMFGKIFILESSEDELICTYNVDSTNISDHVLIANTILCHRVKSHNVLYTLNALNTLIKNLNKGIEDHNFPISWENYKNSVLLTRAGVFVRINTKIKEILNIS